MEKINHSTVVEKPKTSEKNKESLSFFNLHKDDVIKLFRLADSDNELPAIIDDPRVLHDYALSRWMKGDHWNPNSRYAHSVPAEDLDEFFYLVDKLQLKEEIIPPKGTAVDEVVVVGSTFSANFRRTSLAKSLIDSGRVIFKEAPKICIWAGQRPSYKSEEVDFADFLSQGYKDEHEVFQDETDMARFVLHTLWGSKSNGRLLLPEPVGIYLPEPSELQTFGSSKLQKKPPISKLGLRDYSQYEYYIPEGHQTIKILNAEAVPRRQGEPRHTTESCAKEWLALNNIPNNYTILEVNGNPHAYRINAEIKRVFSDAGRPDINIIGAAISARHDSPPSLYLGEIARILYNDY
jgi:hypothetical protein